MRSEIRLEKKYQKSLSISKFFKLKHRFWGRVIWLRPQINLFTIKKTVVLIIFLGSAYYFLNSSFFQVQQVELILKQNNYINTDQSEEFIKKEVFAKNIFQIDVQKLSKKIINQDNFIKEVTVNKVLPNNLNIIITEDTPVIKIIDQKSCFLVNINAKELWQGDKSKCLLITLPQVVISENNQIYYNKIYLQYIIKINNFMFKNEQTLPFSYKVIAQPKVYLKLDFKKYKVLLDMDVNVLYNWYRYSLVQKNLALKDFKNKTIDLTHKDVVIY